MGGQRGPCCLLGGAGLRQHPALSLSQNGLRGDKAGVTVLPQAGWPAEDDRRDERSMKRQDREPPSARTRVRRIPYRGVYDRDTIYATIDAALVGHVGFVADELPYVIPMAIARRDDELLLHGSAASRLMRVLRRGAEVCVSVTHLDGVVVARSAFNSSMNYRSVVVFGRPRPLTDRAEKLDAFRVIVNHLIPGRWDEVRAPNDQELKATTVLALPLEEASAKVRSGPPQGDEVDGQQPAAWAGEIPFRLVSLPPITDPTVPNDVAVPPSVARFRVGRAAAIDDPPT